jgi:hypothetical protein
MTAVETNARNKREQIRWVAVPALAALILVILQPAALGETDRSFETSGSCTIALLRPQTDPDNVRPYLPEGFHPDVNPAGKVELQIEFAECVPFRVDGRGGAPNIGSTVTVRVEKPHDPGVTWGYDLWQSTSRRDFHATASRLGYHTPLVPNSTFELTRIGAVDQAEASIPWGYSPYALTMTAGDPPPVGIPHTGFHYHLGPHGLIEIEYPLENMAINGATATLSARPGSALAKILGADSITTWGALITLDFVGKHRLIPFPG